MLTQDLQSITILTLRAVTPRRQDFVDRVARGRYDQRAVRHDRWPLLHGETFARLGAHPASGVLLFGPPGCAKTTLARCMARASGGRCAFISLSGAGVYNMYLGEAERTVRETFARARANAPLHPLSG